MISSAMGDTKVENAETSNAEFITSTDPSCLMQMDGILRHRKSAMKTIHLASILAQTETLGASGHKGTA
jgi:L-lactate dehydrogenase complex protein LldE